MVGFLMMLLGIGVFGYQIITYIYVGFWPSITLFDAIYRTLLTTGHFEMALSFFTWVFMNPAHIEIKYFICWVGASLFFFLAGVVILLIQTTYYK